MLALTRTLIEFTVLAAIISLGMTGGKLLRDQVRQSTDSRDRLLAGSLGGPPASSCWDWLLPSSHRSHRH